MARSLGCAMTRLPRFDLEKESGGTAPRPSPSKPATTPRLAAASASPATAAAAPPLLCARDPRPTLVQDTPAGQRCRGALRRAARGDQSSHDALRPTETRPPRRRWPAVAHGRHGMFFSTAGRKPSSGRLASEPASAVRRASPVKPSARAGGRQQRRRRAASPWAVAAAPSAARAGTLHLGRPRATWLHRRLRCQQPGMQIGSAATGRWRWPAPPAPPAAAADRACSGG